MSTGHPEHFSSYDDGRRDARLDGHDRGIAGLRSDVKTIDGAVARLDLATQRLADAASASAEATIKLAEAVNAEKENAANALAAATAQSTSRWTKRDSLVTGLGASVTAITGIWIAVHH
jgi:predicted  nucleic acid-binding Zn-ribbon protein